jgi:hypothetical protein
MKRKTLVSLSLVLSLLSVQVFAVENQKDTSFDEDSPFSAEAPSAEELAGAEEIPFELDPVSVEGARIEFHNEVALRIIRQAYGSKRSNRREDRDNWVCWLESNTGSHFKRLNCARNGDLEAMAPDGLNPLGGGGKRGGYGQLMRTDRPVNRYKFEQSLANLPGSAEFDREFVNMVMMGDRPPRDIPDDAEVEQFASAWLEVGKLNKRRKSESVQIAAIEDQGLTLKRYNRIADLIETYQSVENQVAEQVKALR